MIQFSILSIRFNFLLYLYKKNRLVFLLKTRYKGLKSLLLIKVFNNMVDFSRLTHNQTIRCLITEQWKNVILNQLFQFTHIDFVDFLYQFPFKKNRKFKRKNQKKINFYNMNLTESRLIRFL